MDRRTCITAAAGAIAVGRVRAQDANEKPVGRAFKLKYAPHLIIFKLIHQRGFTGIVGMEHGNSRKGMGRPCGRNQKDFLNDESRKSRRSTH